MPAARTRTLALTEPYPLKIEDVGRKSPASDPSPPLYGTDGETRTLTAFATAPSRRRVYQFHHVGMVGFDASPRPKRARLKDCNFTTSSLLRNLVCLRFLRFRGLAGLGRRRPYRLVR